MLPDKPLQCSQVVKGNEWISPVKMTNWMDIVQLIPWIPTTTTTNKHFEWLFRNLYYLAVSLDTVDLLLNTILQVVYTSHFW